MRIILPAIKWDPANDGLDIRDFKSWARDFEFRQVPRDTIFPAPNQVWEANCDCIIGFFTFGFETPFPVFPFGKTRLQKGERARVLDNENLPVSPWPKPMVVSLRPIRYEDLEESIVPKNLRDLPGYTGYLLTIRTVRTKFCLDTEQAFLNEHFRLVG
jgi:hypothetical protein